MNDIGFSVIVTGRVQGVGFRYFTAREALKLGLTGRAQNLNDGTVKVELFGHKEIANELLKWLSVGPISARVDSIIINEIPFVRKTKFHAN
ncbi:MAG: acylphosphatase [Psychromonas sp.]|nr:acylphosphatase [Psychromonas sp.]